MKEHTQRHAFCQVTYWAGNSAAFSDEEWTHCKVSPLGMYSSCEQTFENSEQGIYSRDNLIRFLNMAYDHGHWAAKLEIRDALGIKEPRS